MTSLWHSPEENKIKLGFSQQYFVFPVQKNP
jgi:hypothetical protein